MLRKIIKTSFSVKQSRQYKKNGWLLSFFIICLLGSDSLLASNISIPVSVKTIEQLAFHPLKKVPAQVVSLKNSLLSAELSALVKKVHVKIGERVLKDQLLVSLECDDYELDKEQFFAEQQALEADYQFADYQYQRSKKLLKTKSVSQETHRRQASQVSKLSAEKQLLNIKIQRAEKMISRCQIKAPFAGVIARRLINIGENVASRSPLLRLTDVDNLEVEVQMPVVMVDDLDYTSLNFIYREQSYPLKVRAVIPSVETRARHQRVRLSFLDSKALPDAYGMVEMSLRQLNVPANFLVKRNDQLGLFLIKEEPQGDTPLASEKRLLRVQFFALKNALPGRSAKINLPPSTRVVIAGRNALVDGQIVHIEDSSL